MEALTVVWLIWAFVCAFGLRVLFARMFRHLGGSAKLAAYAMWLFLIILGFTLVGLSGFQLYGYEPSDPRQFMGYLILFFSPFGLPTAVGAPAVLILDFARAAAKLKSPPVP
ncbi:MAG: hypothetical protein ACT6SD_00515 [Brevundimonas sp.]|uniref:hypothetical protein n=1 Tax=Brevundimonas sp. TaxID=1871086 RepID=UPI004034BE71